MNQVLTRSHYCELQRLLIVGNQITFELLERPYSNIEELNGKRNLLLNFKQDKKSQAIPFLQDLRRGMVPNDGVPSAAGWNAPGNSIHASFVIHEATEVPGGALDSHYKALFDPKPPYEVPESVCVVVKIVNQKGTVMYRQDFRQVLTTITTGVFSAKPFKLRVTKPVFQSQS